MSARSLHEEKKRWRSGGGVEEWSSGGVEQWSSGEGRERGERAGGELGIPTMIAEFHFSVELWS